MIPFIELIDYLFEAAVLHQHGLIKATNKPFCKLFQFEEYKTIPGKTFSDLFPQEFSLQIEQFLKTECFTRACSEIIDRDRGITFSVRRLRRNGAELLFFQPVYIHDELSDIIHDMNNPLGALSLGLFNITQRLDPENRNNQEQIVAEGIDLTSFQNYLQERKILRYLDYFERGISALTGYIEKLRDFRERYFTKDD